VTTSCFALIEFRAAGLFSFPITQSKWFSFLKSAVSPTRIIDAISHSFGFSPEIFPCRPSSGARMKLTMNLPEARLVDVCVDLRGGETRVTEHLLNRAQIGAVAE